MEVENQIKCPNCLSLVAADVDLCPHCKVEFYNCSNCNSIVLGTDTVCENCNSKLTGISDDDFFDRIPGNLQNFLIYSTFIVLLFFMNYFLRNCAF